MIGSDYLEDATRQFQKLKALADRALTQVAEENWFAVLDAESNGIALIVKHISGKSGEFDVSKEGSPYLVRPRLPEGKAR